MTGADDILRPMRRTIDTIVDEDALRDRLDSGAQLRIKYGVDLTAPDLHLGHAVNLWLMRHLQEHGHRVVFLLGDLTTRVGDPTGKSETRPVLSDEQIEENARAFLAQVSLVLDTSPEVFEVRRNSEWFDRMPVAELLSLFSMTTHAQLMARDMFRERLAQGREIALHELTYPVLQGYDSFAMDSDLTIVGSDQLFNEMMGRQYQQRLGARPQSLITTVITPGLDGGPKQSKSLGNYVALTDTATDKFGRAMSLPDDLTGVWAGAYTTLDDDEVGRISSAAAQGGHAARDAKLAMAEAIVVRYHGTDVAARERESFLRVFSQGAAPERTDAVQLSSPVITVRGLLELVRPELSGSARRRLLAQGAARLDGVVVSDPDLVLTVEDGSILRTGRRTWTRLDVRP
ncbi:MULTISPECIES: tyrosine--tRNA ligase [unclassified Microbacterium]|uniref:tyrosine--tRNA ligase n=1 Tax=unclassified Microbacterium TaxID=2609290 RepID=UPI0012F92599|nr:tyrosine--tRNA ligase [Microbacterium sp. MAH-37]MVQ40724.1 tyrosine--tRNA ligase [Microbacterium sp. MAH-37]